MAQLGKIFPTDDYAQDLLRRMYLQVSQNAAIKVLTNATVESVEGFVGNFGVNVSVTPRRVTDSCNACSKCEPVCPIEVEDEFNEGMSRRKAIYLPSPVAYPSIYAIDEKNCNLCGKCLAACPKDAIDLSEAPAKLEIKVGAIIVATGFDPYEPKPTEFGYKLSEKIVTLPQFVRMLDEKNPVLGKIELDDNLTRNIVFIGCVGSRQQKRSDGSSSEDEKLNEYCSRVCCAASLHSEIELKKRYPQWNVFHLYRDIRTYGRNQERLYEEAGNSPVIFLRYDENDPPTVAQKNDKILVTVHDRLSNGEQFEIAADLVVLAVGMIPRQSTKDLQLKLKVSSSPDGFIQEVHAKLRPVEVSTDGIFIAGAAQGPKDITESAIAGSAAAAKAAAILANGRVELEPTVAQIDQTKCDGCVLCVEVCSFKAISVVEASEGGEVKKRAIVNEAFCKGCGACAAICPPRAIGVRNFTLPQISAVLEAALAGS
jgi:heterodisulfide reductase subunit A